MIMDGILHMVSVSDAELEYSEVLTTYDLNGKKLIDGNSHFLFNIVSDTKLKIFKSNNSLYQTHKFVFSRTSIFQAKSDLSTHLCGDDRYQSQMTIDSYDSFLWEHQIYGPRKDYSMKAIYKRLS